jgi:phosphoesterase RecJ-like protein
MSIMNLDMFKDLIGENVVILGHHNADPDSIGAAVGVNELLSRITPDSNVNVIMPKDISNLSRSIIDALGLDVSEEHNDSFDTAIIVDTGSLNQLDVWEEKVLGVDSLIVIDHHSRSLDIEKHVSLYFIDEEASSASEIVYRMMNSVGHIPSEKTAKALLAGIIFDSKFFSIGSADMFESVSGLLGVTWDISEVRGLFSSEYTVPEKIARLKAAQRMTYSRVNGWLIAFSELGSFQSSGARAMISLGADVAIVTGKEKNAIRSSLRSTNKFYSKTGIHLGVLVSHVSHEVEGDGSGHPTAAGFNGSCDIEDFNNNILGKLSELLSC